MDSLSDWEWTLESLPARYFNWRSRGNSLTWGVGNFPQLEQTYDLLVATSMVDLTALRGLRPNLANVPTVVYFHENQFGYPENDKQQGMLEIKLTSIYTALAADTLLFNSDYNRQTFLTGAEQLLSKMPDAVPNEVMARLRAGARVLPVPIEDTLFSLQAKDRPNTGPVELLWNHRWEWDKGPDLLLAVANNLADRGMLERGFRFNVVGEQFRQEPTPFAQLKRVLEKNNALGRWGYGESLTDYRDLLSRCHLVLSTASHDFQGLAMLEAAVLGCIPLVPDTLAYPEWFDKKYQYRYTPGNIELSAVAIADALLNRFYPHGLGVPVARPRFNRANLQALSWQHLGSHYRELLFGEPIASNISRLIS